MAKKKFIEFYPSLLHQNAMAFCVQNGITISPKVIRREVIKLIIRIEKGKDVKVMESPVEYTNRELWRPIYEIYLTYFKRMADRQLQKKAVDNIISFKNNV